MTIFVKDSLRASVEAASGGRQTVFYTEKNQPTFMNVIPKFMVEDIDSSLGSGVHPAFIVDGREVSEIFIGTYQGIIKNGELLSLPGVDPTRSQDFDAFLAAAKACGQGFHLMTNAEWAALQLWCMKNGYQPRGNTNYGRSHESSFETGSLVVPGTPGDTSSGGRTYTGSGPASWRHDNTPNGISDMVGNIWEWVGGLRLQDGEIQILPNNDAAASSADMGKESSQWRAIRLSDGALVTPGTSGTAHYDATSESSNVPRLNNKIEHQKGDVGDDDNTSGTDGWAAMKDLSAASGVSVPGVLKVLGLFPHKVDGQENEGRLYVRNHGERLPSRGGGWNYGAHAGLGALHLHHHRGYTHSARGARPAKI